MPQQINRLVIAFAVFILLFLVLQQVLKPDSFGVLGHYRAMAIEENANKEMHYAGSENCVDCHDLEHEDKSYGFHAQLKCEVCHGPGLKHALYAGDFKDGELPDSLKLYKPDQRKDCAICHNINAARVKILFDTIDNTVIKQVDVMEHNLLNKKTQEEMKCTECHYAHLP